MATIRVTLSMTYYGQLFQNVLHFNKSDYVASELPNLIADIKTGWIDQVKWCQSDGLKYVNMKLHHVGSSTPDTNEVLAINGGTGSSSEYKPFNAHIIRIQSVQAGRSGRGRVYIGGIASNLTDFGFIKTAILATWATKLAAITAMFGPTATSDFQLGVNAHTEVDNWKAMQSLSINPVEGIQRRRNIGVGI